MGAVSIWLTFVVLVFLDNSLANPLLEGGIAGRTLFQQNMKCGTRSAYKRISMSNPTGNNQNCEYNIRAYSVKVCQVRILFHYLDLEQPKITGSRQYAFCSGDHLAIDGMPFDLCGSLRQNHVYVPFDVKRITDEMQIKFQVSSNNLAMWSMEIEQIECAHKAALVSPDELQAPDGCLQYFHESSGRVESFNFGYRYYGDTKYAICFNRNYNQNAMLELSDITFQMDSINPAGFDDACLSSVGTESKDYIAIPFAEVFDRNTIEDPHSLFCDNVLDGKELNFNGAGPIVIHVNTDRYSDPDPANNVEKGFSFRFRILNYRG